MELSAHKEGNAHPGASLGGLAADSSFPSSGFEGRGPERRLVHGRAALQLVCGSIQQGRLIDLAFGSAGVFMNVSLRPGTVFTFQCDCFANGRRHVFEVPAEAIYTVLVSGKGFRMGVRFDGDSVRSQIRAILT